MFAAGIFPSEIFVLADRSIQCQIIFEMASHFGGEFRHSKCTSVGLRGSRRLENNAPVGCDYSFVFATGARLLGMSVEGLALIFSLLKLCLSPGLGAMDTRMSYCRQQQTRQHSGCAHARA